MANPFKPDESRSVFFPQDLLKYDDGRAMGTSDGAVLGCQRWYGSVDATTPEEINSWHRCLRRCLSGDPADTMENPVLQALRATSCDASVNPLKCAPLTFSARHDKNTYFVTCTNPGTACTRAFHFTKRLLNASILGEHSTVWASSFLVRCFRRSFRNIPFQGFPFHCTRAKPVC